MNDGKSKKGGRFEALVAAVEAEGPLGATVLASDRPRRAASNLAERAARQMVGVVAGDGGARVDRLAALLDKLRAADAGATPSKRRHAR
ncbi:MAG: hypothetical protein ACREJ3_01915 [Polyangiaceae bacterium]